MLNIFKNSFKSISPFKRSIKENVNIFISRLIVLFIIIITTIILICFVYGIHEFICKLFWR
jgi:hypothetical protein